MKTIRVFILTISAFVIATLVSEVFARTFWEQKNDYEARVVIPDVYNHHILLPGSNGDSRTSEWRVVERINTIGIRDRMYTIPKPNKTYRILLLGDSFVYGWGVNIEDSMGKQLEQLLSSGLNNKLIEVVNGGVPSYSPTLSYLQYMNALRSLRPDLVLYVFDMSDVNDEVEYNKTAVIADDGTPLRVGSKYATISLFDRFMGKLYLYHFIMKTLMQKESQYRVNQEGYDHWIGMRENTLSIAPIGWRLVEKRLRFLRDAVVSDGAEFVITIIPRSPQIAPGLLNEVDREKYGFPSDRMCCLQTFTVLSEIAQRMGAQFWNPHSYLVSHKDEELFYFYDGHFTSRGHALMAEYLKTKIEKMLLVL